MFSGLKATVKRNRKFRKELRNLGPISESDTDSDSQTQTPPLDSPTNFDFKPSQCHTELDDLAVIFSGIDIKSPTKVTNMSVENTNYQQLRLFLDIIPHFEGDPCELNNFIAACDDTFNNFRNENDIIKKLIFRGIVGKLKGKALTLISSRTELDTWEKVKDVLRLSFCDQRSFTCLLHELHSLRPNAKENSYNFGVRCQYNRSLIFSSINSDLYMTNEAKIAQIQNIEKLILITFLKYLPPNIQTAVRLRNPPNLETAMQLVIEEENFISLVNEGRRHVQQALPTPNFKTPVAQNMFQSNQQRPFSNQALNFGTRPGSFPSYSLQPPPRTFPSQPIPVQPRPVQQRYFSNQQVFGKEGPKTNVWKPTNRVPTDSPTPMSIVTQSTRPPQNIFQRQIRPNFNPQQQPRPKFRVEELYNLENNENYEQEYYQGVEQFSENQSYYPEVNYNDTPTEGEEQCNDNLENVAEENQKEENFFLEASGANLT